MIECSILGCHREAVFYGRWRWWIDVCVHLCEVHVAVCEPVGPNELDETENDRRKQS